MRRFFFILILFGAYYSPAQDSLLKGKLRIHDCALFMAFDFIENERKVNPVYIQSFTKDPLHNFDNSGYPDTSSYTLYNNPGGETDGGEFGFMTTFKFNQSGKLKSKFKPRIGFFYNYKQFFSYDLNLSNTSHLASIGGDRELDSVAVRNISYSYYSEQMCVQLGFNYDVLQKRSVILYTGFLFSQGVSFKNEFTTKVEDSYRIDSRTKDGHVSTGTAGKTGTHSYNSTEPFSRSVRVSVPIGLQQRFSNVRKFSMGFMLEGSFGYERYFIEKGKAVNYGYIAIIAGLRFSLDKHI